MFNPKVRQFLCVFVICAGLISCKDSDNSPDTDPPTLPELQQFQPDFSYFGVQSQSTTVQEGVGYTLAAQLVQTSVVPLLSLSQIYYPFLVAAQEVDADYDDGVWEWTYTYSEFEESAEMRLTAEESGQNIEWALFLSVDSDDVSFENYLFMDGTTATDGTEGTWSIYGLDDEGTTTPVFTLDWTQEDEDNQTATYEIINPETEESVIMDYSKADFEHMIDFTSEGDEEELLLYWNTESGTGYIDQSGEGRLCWDAEFEDMECE